ncbi:MAG: gas vesicle protein K [Candidatus Bipolaricaulia bacterium]
MPINIDERSLKHGVLGLVIALVEIIQDALNHQALRRMESGSLTEAEVERLGKALMELDTAIEELKQEQGIVEAVQSVRDGLDHLAYDTINQLVNPEKWAEIRRKAEERQHARTSRGQF